MLLSILLFIFLKKICSLERLSGADYIIKRLEQYRINTIFGYPGGANLKLFDSLYKSTKIKTIINRNEQNSGFCAEGFAKTGKNIGVIFTTSGPGLTNIITPLQDAYSDGIPLLAISGQVGSKNIGTSAFQECNAIELTKTCVKYNKLIDCIKNLEYELDKSINIALNLRNGPVHLDICSDVFSAEYDFNFNEIQLKSINTNSNNYYNIFNEIGDILKKSRKPVLIVGQGANKYYNEVRLFSKKFNIPVATTLHGLGIIDQNDELSLGMVGMHGSVAANMAIQSADFIIGLGYRFDDRTIGNPKLYALEAKKKFGIVHIDISKEKINEVKKIINPKYSINTNCINFLNYMNTIDIKSKKFEWITYLKIIKTSYNIEPEKDMTIPYIISKLSEKLEPFKNYLITTGVGVHQMNVAQYFKWKYPKTLLTSGSQGTMGVGIHYATGAQIANPNKLVMCIDGDASFMMSLDLMTIAENKIPIKILIMDNQNLQMVTNWQEKFYDKKYSGSKLKNPNFIKLANSMGIAALQCNNVDDIDNCINEILYSKYPLLIHFKVKGQQCLPFVAPNKALNDMILE